MKFAEATVCCLQETKCVDDLMKSGEATDYWDCNQLHDTNIILLLLWRLHIWQLRSTVNLKTSNHQL